MPSQPPIKCISSILCILEGVFNSALNVLILWQIVNILQSVEVVKSHLYYIFDLLYLQTYSFDL